jgi:hypothetical protein
LFYLSLEHDRTRSVDRQDHRCDRLVRKQSARLSTNVHNYVLNMRVVRRRVDNLLANVASPDSIESISTSYDRPTSSTLVLWAMFAKERV